jgi:hypothetical protein
MHDLHVPRGGGDQLGIDRKAGEILATMSGANVQLARN